MIKTRLILLTYKLHTKTTNEYKSNIEHDIKNIKKQFAKTQLFHG